MSLEWRDEGSGGRVCRFVKKLAKRSSLLAKGKPLKRLTDFLVAVITRLKPGENEKRVLQVAL